MRRGVLGSLTSLTEEITHAVSSGVSSGASNIMDRYHVRHSSDYTSPFYIFDAHNLAELGL